MKMTEEQISGNLAAFERAMRDGGNVSAIEGWSSSRTWQPLPSAYFHPEVIYRVKPEPKLRPWNSASEAPQQARFKLDGWDSSWVVPLFAHAEGLVFCDGTKNSSRTWVELFNNWVHSLDDGQTWLPCGVMEVEK